MRYLIFFGSALLVSGCVSVPNTTGCAVKGTLLAGAICSETNTGKTSELTFDELVEFMQPNENKGGAICFSSSDYQRMKTALEQACRALGNRCQYEVPKINADAIK